MNWLDRLNQPETPRTRTDKADRSPSVSSVSTVPGHIQHENVPPDLHGISLNELQTLAGDDWLECESDPALLETFASAVTTRRMRERGEVPPIYTATTACAQCGPVPIFEGCPPQVQACPWCLNRRAGRPVPTISAVG